MVVDVAQLYHEVIAHLSGIAQSHYLSMH